MKRCSQCKEEKELIEFNKYKSSKDGHRSNCKSCSRLYREKNKERDKEYRKKNKDKRAEYDRGRDKGKVKLNKIIYYTLNKEEILSKRKEHYVKNKSKKLEYQKQYQTNNRESRNKYLSERRSSDVLFKLVTNIRNLINNSFYEQEYSKNSKTQQILGISFEELVIYIESKFESWMTWENRGLYNGKANYGWDIDHIIPLSSAKSENDLVLLNHYTNLQPLCSYINRNIKRNNIEIQID